MMHRIIGQGITAEVIRGHDWANHPLGPVDRWPEILVNIVNVVLSSPLPMQVYWGPEMYTIYNDALLQFIQDRHPDAMGRPVREVWPDAWDLIQFSLLQSLPQGSVSAFRPLL